MTGAAATSTNQQKTSPKLSTQNELKIFLDTELNTLQEALKQASVSDVRSVVSRVRKIAGEALNEAGVRANNISANQNIKLETLRKWQSDDKVQEARNQLAKTNLATTSYWETIRDCSERIFERAAQEFAALKEIISNRITPPATETSATSAPAPLAQAVSAKGNAPVTTRSPLANNSMPIFRDPSLFSACELNPAAFPEQIKQAISAKDETAARESLNSIPATDFSDTAQTRRILDGIAYLIVTNKHQNVALKYLADNAYTIATQTKENIRADAYHLLDLIREKKISVDSTGINLAYRAYQIIVIGDIGCDKYMANQAALAGMISRTNNGDSELATDIAKFQKRLEFILNAPEQLVAGLKQNSSELVRTITKITSQPMYHKNKMDLNLLSRVKEAFTK